MSSPERFYLLVREVAESEAFRRLRHIRHHINSTTYEHSLKVAFFCYRHYRHRRQGAALGRLVRAALLHDFYLYDHNGLGIKGGFLHTVTHPKRALRNAERLFSALAAGERDAIGRHMFPLTPLPPVTRCGWLVCFYDKLAAWGDLCNLRGWQRDAEWQYAVRRLSARP